jgi:hypothetical protein
MARIHRLKEAGARPTGTEAGPRQLAHVSSSPVAHFGISALQPTTNDLIDAASVCRALC